MKNIMRTTLRTTLKNSTLTAGLSRGRVCWMEYVISKATRLAKDSFGKWKPQGKDEALVWLMDYYNKTAGEGRRYQNVKFKITIYHSKEECLGQGEGSLQMSYQGV